MILFLIIVFFLLVLYAHYFPPFYFFPVIDLSQELKIEGEQPEVLEEDNLDLMLPAKKKKSKKVEIDEGDVLDKDDGKN